MNLDTVLSTIDAEIARLQHVRSMLTDISPVPVNRKVGRPKKITTAVLPKKRTMSAEGKARIAAAQKKRWAAMKKKSS